MSETLSAAIKAIEAQQGEARTPVWMCGEQLKEIITREPENAELVLQDLTAGGMKLKDCEKKIKAFADKHKTGNFACVTPAEAEEIIREYFGLRSPVLSPQSSGDGERADTRPAPTEGERKKIIDLEDFF